MDGIKTGKKNLILMLLIGILGMRTGADAESWQWSISDDFGPARAPAKSEIDWETHPVGWSDDRRLTFDDYGARPYIVSDADGLHLVWTAPSKDAPYRHQVYYMKSVDNGRSWIKEKILSKNATGFAGVAGFISDTNGLHVISTDERDCGEGKEQIYYRKSTDGGTTWGPEERLTDTEARCAAPSITSDGAIVYVGWCDARSEDFEIYLTCSSDGGKSWAIPWKVTGPSHFFTSRNSMAVDGRGLHLTWEKWDQDVGCGHIYCKKSLDEGKTWTDPQRVTPNRPEYVEFHCPLITSDPNGLHLIYEEWGLGDPSGFWSRLWYSVSRNGGDSWSVPLKIADSPYSADLIGDRSDLHLFWTDRSAGKILHSESSDGGNIWSEGQPLSRVSWMEGGLKAAAANNCMHLIWADKRSVDGEGSSLYYKFYDPTPPTGRMTKPEIVRLYNDIGQVIFVSEIGTFEDPESRYTQYCNVQVRKKLIGSNQDWQTIVDKLVGGNQIMGSNLESGYIYSVRFRVLTETYRWSEWSEWSDGAKITGEPCENVIVYPNPCQLSIHDKIIFDNLDACGGTVVIYTLTGEEIWRDKKTGETKISWDLCNKYGKKVSSGIYIYRIYGGVNNKTGNKLGKIAIIR